jgi:hypothetical protein
MNAVPGCGMTECNKTEGRNTTLTKNACRFFKSMESYRILSILMYDYVIICGVS